MQPQRYDFPPVTRGDTTFLSFVLKTRDLFTQQVKLVDLTGATVTWTVRRQGLPNLVKTTTDGGLRLDLHGAQVVWDMTSADTMEFVAGSNPYRVRIALPDGTVDTYLVGSIPAQD